jgi:hypothetical protein
MSSHDPVAPSLSGHLRTLGICWIVYGVIRLIMAVCLVIYGSTATVMFGTLLNRVADPLALMSVFHFIYTVMIALSDLHARNVASNSSYAALRSFRLTPAARCHAHDACKAEVLEICV